VALRYRIRLQPETAQDLALASDEKYWEGLELLVIGRRGAGIYLLGYSLEMMLKNACLVADGARPADAAHARFEPMRRRFRERMTGIRHESWHSVWFWVHLLRIVRTHHGRPLEPLVDAGLVQRARRIYANWAVEMRYKPDQALREEADQVYNDVTWIRDRRVELMVG